MASDIVTDRPKASVAGGRAPAPGDGVGQVDGQVAGIDHVAVAGRVSASATASAPADGSASATPETATGPSSSRRPWPVRFGRAVVGTFVTDLRIFFSRPVALLREKHLRAIPGTVASVTLIALFAIIQHFRPAGITFVNAVAGVHQGEPLWEVLLQLPLSMFAPAPMLPAWGAMTQVFVAFGISECWLGWRKMLAIAVLTSAVTSMAARIMVAVSSYWSIGTPEIDNWQLDTGPSVGVVALLIYLALRVRTYWIVALTAVSMGGEAALLPNLAGREHLVAISLGVITYFLLDVWWPAWQRRRSGSATSDQGG